ncbi:hypothetical protein [Egbenema bharatensis]|uniref:hypothetical protein n=1 Tax=Egbenema bharatensis TaxID=3463334 RepID=UPI003A88EF8E
MLVKAVRIVPPVPTDSIPEPWAMVVRSLDQSPPLLPLLVFLPCLPQSASPINPDLLHLLQMRLDMSEADWRIALYWVVKKKWNPRLKVPIVRTLVALFEPWAELLFRQLELCEACYDALPSVNTRYHHAAHWYGQIIQEAKRLEAKIILDNEGGGKTPIVKERYAIIAAFKDLQNPVSLSTSPHLHCLIETALRLERCDRFHQQYWKPFLSACSRWTQATDQKTCQEIYIEGDRIVCQSGQGRAKLVLFRLT